jgi:hypothetical protein
MAMSFIAGSSEVVVMDTSFTVPAEGTVCFWITPQADYAVNARAWGSDGSFEVRFPSSNAPNAEIYSADGIAASTLTAGTRYHMLCTWDWDTVNVTLQIYLDGLLDNSGLGSLPSAPGVSAITFANRTGASDFWTGILDDFRLYNRILTAHEAAAIHRMRGADGIVNGLLHRWLLDEKAPGVLASGSGSVLDVTAGDMSGTPANTPTYEESAVGRRRAA